MDMTPMIDCVFLLIIFFMIVSDISQQDLAEIKLPKAEMAQKDENEEGRMIVNIHPNGELEIKRQRYASLDSADARAALQAYLANEVSKGKKDEKGLSERSLLVRADMKTQFKEVQKVMQICGLKGIQIYKVHLAASENKQ